MKKYRDGVYYNENLNELCIITNITYLDHFYSSSLIYDCELENDDLDLILKWDNIILNELVYLGEL